MKDLSTSYLLAVIGLVTPVAGLHYFYLNKPVMGILFLATFGFCGVGTLVDLFRLPGLVDDENLKIDWRRHTPRRLPATTPEQQILQVAQAHEGALTVALASVTTGLSLKECRRILERMAKDGDCQRDVNEEGAGLYVFPGLRSNKPFEI